MELFNKMKSVLIHSFGVRNIRCRHLVTVNNRVYEVNADVAQFIYVLKKSLSIEDVAIYMTALNNRRYTIEQINQLLDEYAQPMFTRNS